MPTDDEQQAPAAAAAAGSSSRQPQQQQGGDEDDDGRVPIVDLTPLREGGAAGKAAVAAAIKRCVGWIGLVGCLLVGVWESGVGHVWIVYICLVSGVLSSFSHYEVRSIHPPTHPGRVKRWASS